MGFRPGCKGPWGGVERERDTHLEELTIKINKKLNEISLTKTLNLLKNEYFRYKECKSYEYWQILTLNASLIEINRKNKYEILSLIKYPIIEIIQKHEIDNKKIIIYIKYNFLNIYPLEININCNNKLYSIPLKISTVSILIFLKTSLYSS